jgi:hypothetical protein
MAIAAPVNYSKKLLNKLKKHYTNEQIDDFEWYTDIESDNSYALDFIDHNRQRKNIIVTKRTGTISVINAS